LQVDNSYLYREGDRYVIFDETGPGVVWRIWMMGLDGLFQGALADDVRVELNDEPRPRLALDRKALFAGTRAPFVAPLAGDRTVSSGGYYSVVPIPFARRLRISTSTVPQRDRVSQRPLSVGGPSSDKVGGPFTDHDRRGVRVATHDVRHDRCVCDVEAPYPVNP